MLLVAFHSALTGYPIVKFSLLVAITQGFFSVIDLNVTCEFLLDITELRYLLTRCKII